MVNITFTLILLMQKWRYREIKVLAQGQVELEFRGVSGPEAHA